jgi:hypothetical protein
LHVHRCRKPGTSPLGKASFLKKPIDQLTGFSGQEIPNINGSLRLDSRLRKMASKFLSEKLESCQPHQYSFIRIFLLFGDIGEFGNPYRGFVAIAALKTVN